MAFTLSNEFDKTSIKMTKINPPISGPSERLAFTLENVLTPNECQALIDTSEERKYSVAVINAGNQEILDTDYRKGSRCIIDNQNFASNLWSRISSYIPQTYQSYKAIGLNERLRFLRYDSGDFFKPHSDACYARPDGSEFSLITTQIYLNEGFSGGETTFLNRNSDDRVAVVPKTGMILVFDQRLYHSGSLLIEGRKYTIRTEVMFQI